MYIHWLTVTDSDSNMTIQEDYWCYSPLVYLPEEILPSDWNSRTLYTFPMLVLSQTVYTLHPTFGQQYINLEHSHLRIVIPNATLTTHAVHLSAELEFHSSWWGDFCTRYKLWLWSMLLVSQEPLFQRFTTFCETTLSIEQLSYTWGYWGTWS